MPKIINWSKYQTIGINSIYVCLCLIHTKNLYESNIFSTLAGVIKIKFQLKILLFKIFDAGFSKKISEGPTKDFDSTLPT